MNAEEAIAEVLALIDEGKKRKPQEVLDDIECFLLCLPPDEIGVMLPEES